MGIKVRRLGNLKHTIVPGKGIELRRWTNRDATKLFHLIEQNRMYLREWMNWEIMTQSVSDTSAFIEDSLRGYTTGRSYRLGVYWHGQLVGTCSLEQISVLNGSAAIGYWLDKDKQGNGLITRSVSALFRYAFAVRGLRLLELHAATNNRPSRNIATRLGMQYDGILRDRGWNCGKTVDHAVYSLLREEWVRYNTLTAYNESDK